MLANGDDLSPASRVEQEKSPRSPENPETSVRKKLNFGSSSPVPDLAGWFCSSSGSVSTYGEQYIVWDLWKRKDATFRLRGF